MDIATLSHLTGVKPKDILFNSKLGTDSQNPIDIQYREDQKNMQDFGSALLNGDAKKIDSYSNNPNPAVKKRLSQYHGQGGYDKLAQDFHNAYRRYYVPEKWGVTPANYPFVPAAQTGASGIPSVNGGSVPH